ncbi:MAG: 50S ribosomal protein L22 [Candidatus Marinimicrobia bacterium]|jgi:large subunit ribosomal protein L22|nr:50S ribosomal protein L22 [Candidatus Neomarinimicrobiota bacterium]MBP9004844.1 50S ribosomal protein L22 [Candidatus Neomarinimicrobiota bacterium]NLA22515.1 50S ribosomal protein L22 [Candidatus Neomarinimicrobiota bacterium]HNZ36401.1 50S ribosomal protein L22 [Candidatus Neomarinimicrobiota bacterium]HOD37540.1 50S ribosomal protein L22 [Candidatus Neomarinimicrobiota bacterium]
MEAKAVHRYVRQSARKVRLVADLVRGKDVETALNLLHFNSKKASENVEKVVRSAVSNLLNSEGGSKLNPEDLYLKTIYVDGGSIAKRFRAGSLGRASIIRRRLCHITVVVAEKENKQKSKVQ